MVQKVSSSSIMLEINNRSEPTKLSLRKIHLESGTEYSFNYDILALVGKIGERSQSQNLAMESGKYNISHSGGAIIKIQASGIIPEGFDGFIYAASIITSIILVIAGIAWVHTFSESKPDKSKGFLRLVY